MAGGAPGIGTELKSRRLVRERSAAMGATIKAAMAPGGGHCIKLEPKKGKKK